MSALNIGWELSYLNISRFLEDSLNGMVVIRDASKKHTFSYDLPEDVCREISRIAFSAAFKEMISAKARDLVE